MSEIVPEEFLEGPANPLSPSNIMGSSLETKKSGTKRERDNFRFCSQALFATYPKCNCDKEKLAELLKEKGAISYAVGREKHIDGSYHLHCYAWFKEKIDTRSSRFFDLEGHHPNIQKPRNKKACYEYVIKDQDYIEEHMEHFEDSTNFVKRKTDFDAWCQYKRSKKTTEVVFPLLLPDGKTLAFKPDPKERKRHWIIKAPPDWGKTYWMQSTFAGQKVMYPKSDCDHPLDAYNGEQVILFDDFKFKVEHKELLIDISNTYLAEKPVYGRTRYTNKFWPVGQTRTMFIVCNDIPWDWDISEWFTTRFNVMDVTDLPKWNPTPPEISE